MLSLEENRLWKGIAFLSWIWKNSTLGFQLFLTWIKNKSWHRLQRENLKRMPWRWYNYLAQTSETNIYTSVCKNHSFWCFTPITYSYIKTAHYATSFPGPLLLFTSPSLTPWDVKRRDPGNKVAKCAVLEGLFCQTEIWRVHTLWGACFRLLWFVTSKVTCDKHLASHEFFLVSDTCILGKKNPSSPNTSQTYTLPIMVHVFFINQFLFDLRNTIFTMLNSTYNKYNTYSTKTYLLQKTKKRKYKEKRKKLK